MVKNIYFSPFVTNEEIEIIPKTVNFKPLDKRLIRTEDNKERFFGFRYTS